jgi:hypothetical protein
MIKHRKKHPVSPSILMRGREIEKKKKRTEKEEEGETITLGKKEFFKASKCFNSTKICRIRCKLAEDFNIC